MAAGFGNEVLIVFVSSKLVIPVVYTYDKSVGAYGTATSAHHDLKNSWFVVLRLATCVHYNIFLLHSNYYILYERLWNAWVRRLSGFAV
jgi:hypothetical protein